LDKFGNHQVSLDVPTSTDQAISPSKLKQNINFLRKIPKDAEASTILIGELPELVGLLQSFFLNLLIFQSHSRYRFITICL
jgi:hypothetical protein